MLTQETPVSGTVAFASVTVTAGTRVKFSFADHTEGGGSLVDGVYKLRVIASKVLVSGVPLDGNGDGVAGDDYYTPTPSYPQTPANLLYRLFGDGDGDRDVDALNYGQFKAAYGVGGAVFD